MIVNRLLQQFVIGILAAVSLLVSSASAACTCSHLQGQEKSEISLCHSHLEVSESADSHESHAEETNLCSASDADCVCAATPSKLIAKSTWIKLQKNVATVSFETSITVAVVGQMNTARVYFVKPFYLSDSFYNLAPKRGPPSL